MTGGRRHVVIGFAASLAALAGGFLWFGNFLYRGMDGVMAVSLIRAARVWSSPWAQSQISHLQGMGAQQAPTNPWLNPGYSIFFMGTTLPMAVGSYLFFAACLFLAVYAFGRALGLGRVITILAAQAACVLTFPPLEIFAGLYIQTRLNPGVVYPIAIAIAMIALLIRIGDCPAAIRQGIMILAFPLLLLYSLLCDPIWTIVPQVSLAIFFAAALASGPDRASFGRRGLTILATGIGLVALSVPSYLRLLLGYTARSRFRVEIIGEIQDRSYAFLPFLNSKAAVLFALLLAGIVLAAARGERRVRLFAAAALAHMALLTGLSAVYLFTGVNWTYPVPAYFQLGALPIYLLLAAAGWHAGLRELRQKFPGLPMPYWLRVPALLVCLLPAVCLVYITGRALVEKRVLLQDRDTNYAQRVPLDHPYLWLLEQQLAAEPGRPFRGSLAMVIPEAKNALKLQIIMWGAGIPTLEEYNQLVSPPLYYLATRALGEAGDEPSDRNRLRVTTPRVGLLRALGVRYVWASTFRSAPLERSADARLAAAPFSTYQLYELRAPNTGTFSPVRVLTARSARETVQLLTASDVDLERDIVLDEPLAGLFVPVRRSAISFGDGSVRVTAESDGRSIVLLPLQFSHALRLRDARGGARLLRANLAQTALVFEREVDAVISLDFGFGRTAGRARDLADLDSLGISADELPRRIDHRLPAIQKPIEY